MLSLEHLAVEERELVLGQVDHGVTVLRYIPVILTTATLYTCIFDPNSVDMATGQLPADQKLDSVNLVRFRKDLATQLKYEKPQLRTVKDANIENERTVIVVRAPAFITFLKNFEYG